MRKSIQKRAAGSTLGLLVALGVAFVAPAPALGLSTFVVNKIGDQPDNNLADAKCDTAPKSGKQCTLRAAIQESNDTPGFDVIYFKITSASKVIAPGSALPPITDAVQINGYSQPGTSQNTLTSGNDAVLKIVVDGISAGDHVNGLRLQGTGATILGLVIQRFDGTGISVTGTSNHIHGNFIGTNAAGTQARGNGSGVTVTGATNFIGSFKTYTRNVISGNEGSGVVIYGNDNRVQGNHIGTTKTGAAALGNGGNGVSVDDAVDARIGGSSSDRNVISGNVGHGVMVFKDDGASNAVIRSNFIGTNAAGTADLGNGNSGVYTDAGSVQVGGTSPGSGNLISGNGAAGINLDDSDSNTIQGNLIGTKADGTGDLGNEGDGILVEGPADDNTIGGAASGSGNVISGNQSDGINMSSGTNNLVQGNVIRLNGLNGVAVRSEGHDTISGNIVFQNGADGINVSGTASGVRIAANQIFSNGGLGIDLVGGTENAAGVTSNDTDDPDPGANDLQNFPVLTSATRSNANGVTTIVGSLNSDPSTQFRIELFIVLAVDASGHGEGQLIWANQNVTTNAGGDVNFNIFVSGLSPGQVLSATATSVIVGNTSEFAANTAVTVGP